METRFKAHFRTTENFKAQFENDESFTAKFGEVYKVNTGNYNDLFNKPSINEVELQGNKTFDELGDHTLTNKEIKTIFDRVFKGGH